jgi:cytochrome c oxidase cbb3-type subunit 1
MNLSSHSPCESAPDASENRAVDVSLRLPLLLLFGNAVHWLVIATLISLVLAIKKIAPDFPEILSGVSWFGYGRLAPIARDLFLYGWASQAALAAGIWIAARLAGRPLEGVIKNSVVVVAILLWNLAVLLGSLAILAGYSTGVEWLEYPNWASATLFASFLLIAIRAILLFDYRRSERVEVAQWYVVAGFCSFPWIYGTANLLLTWKPLQASAQGPIQAWFAGTFQLLWLFPIALAALYALLPRIRGIHLHRRNLATLGFWGVLFLGGWIGLARLIGGPVPAWMAAAGTVSSVFLLIPIFIISMNFLGSSEVESAEVIGDLSRGFLLNGLYALIGAGALGALASLPLVSGALQFTDASEATYQLWVFGAVSLPLFGVLYASIPELLGRDCWCVTLARRHFWITIVGFWLSVGFLVIGGLITGLALIDPVVTFRNVGSFAYPFHVLECLTQTLLFIASLILGGNLLQALAGNYLFPKR